MTCFFLSITTLKIYVYHNLARVVLTRTLSAPHEISVVTVRKCLMKLW